MKRFLLGLCAAAILYPVTAQSAEVWSVYRDDQRGGMVLSAMPSEEESDTDLWLMCRKDGRFDVGAGANSDTGKGNGEKVSVTLSSAGKTATLHGISKSSINAEMTGGTELVTTIARDDALLAVLATGKPIAMGATTLGAKGLQKNLKTFLATCVKK